MILRNESPQTRRYISSNSPEFYGLTDDSQVDMPAEPAAPRHLAAIDALLGPEVSEAARKRCRQILSVYPAGVLEALKTHRLGIDITRGQAVQGVTESGAVALGGYDPMSRRIVFDEAVLMSNIGRHVVTHEVVHAIDHMRGERIEKDKLTMASTRDRDLAPIYARYMANGAVEAIGQIRATIKSEHGTLPPSAAITVEDQWGSMTVQYEQKGDAEVLRIEQQPRTPEKIEREAMLEKITGSKGARELPQVEIDVTLQRGGTAHVVQQGSVSTVTIPKNGVTFTGDIWSDYAHRSGQPEEYVAEAFSHYLEAGNKRDELELGDPDMFAYTERVLQDEFNRHPL